MYLIATTQSPEIDTLLTPTIRVTLSKRPKHSPLQQLRQIAQNQSSNSKVLFLWLTRIKRYKFQNPIYWCKSRNSLTLLKEMTKWTFKKLWKRTLSNQISAIRTITISTIHHRLMILLVISSFSINQCRRNQLFPRKSILKKKQLPSLISLNLKNQRKEMI